MLLLFLAVLWGSGGGVSAPAGAQLVKGESARGTASGGVSTTATVPQVAGKIATRPTVAQDIAVLRVLDKISARTTTLRVPVGGSAAFGLMVMTVRSCQIAPPSEAPESAAFLEIGEMDVNAAVRGKGDGKGERAPDSFSKRLLFSGWMFASSPALSALEHPVYDVSVLACEAKQAPAAPASAPAAPSDSASAGSGSAKPGEAGSGEGAGVPPEPED